MRGRSMKGGFEERMSTHESTSPRLWLMSVLSTWMKWSAHEMRWFDVTTVSIMTTLKYVVLFWSLWKKWDIIRILEEKGGKLHEFQRKCLDIVSHYVFSLYQRSLARRVFFIYILLPCDSKFSEFLVYCYYLYPSALLNFNSCLTGKKTSWKTKTTTWSQMEREQYGIVRKKCLWW